MVPFLKRRPFECIQGFGNVEKGRQKSLTRLSGILWLAGRDLPDCGFQLPGLECSYEIGGRISDVDIKSLIQEDLQ